MPPLALSPIREGAFSFLYIGRDLGPRLQWRYMLDRLINFFHTVIPQTDIVWGGFSLHWYGLCVGLGVAVGMLLIWVTVRRTIEASERNDWLKHVANFAPLILFCGAIGGRIAFILYHLDYFQLNPGEMPLIWHGGWVWYGALLGGLLALIGYCRLVRIDVWRMADALVPGVTLGQAIGRWGNYFNQEAYGAPTGLPWGIPIDEAHRVMGYEVFQYFHPTFLYESLGDLVLALLLFYGAVRMAKQTQVRGCVALLFLISYGLMRFGLEAIRIDRVPVLAGLRVPQWSSLFLVAVACAVAVVLLSKRKSRVMLDTPLAPADVRGTHLDR